MRNLSNWHYLAILTVPFGIILGFQFGIMGLLAFSILNLFICHKCPDSFLFQKAPDSLNRLSGKQFYKAERTYIYLQSTILLLSLLFGVLVWTQPSEKLARLIIKLSPLASLNNNIEIALNYFVAPSSLSTNHPNDIQQGLDFMRQSNPRLAIYAIIFHLAAYFYLPIMIAFSTFDRTRAARASFQYRQTHNSKHPNRWMIFVFIFSLLIGAYILTSKPFIHPDYFINAWVKSLHAILILMSPWVMAFGWMVFLTEADGFISRPHTFFTKHPSAYDLYLESKSE